ncbi:hypothetical protein MMC13_001868, partial [Lambiella insularis]|nr:hypothetical protein [Lambiella insularis]
HARQETREGQTRAISKDYYYIDFHATIDAIKYRIFHLTEKVKNLYKPSQEKKDYYCPRCRSQWTQLEVLGHMSAMGEFMCRRCDGILERDNVSAADMAGHERQSKLHAQLDPLLQIMPQIDAQNIPKNDFDSAFQHAVPIIRDESINPRPKTELIDQRGPPTAAKGQPSVAAAPLEVSLTTSSERLAIDRAEAQRKADVAAQNALPVWHTASTVTGEVTALGNKERERLANRPGGLSPKKEEADSKINGEGLHDELAAYYAQMAQEKVQQAQQDQDSEADDDDEDDEFEDVGIGGASGAATPSSSMSSATPGQRKPLTNGAMNGNGKRVKAESESSGSAPGTNFSTPAGSGFMLEETEIEGSLAKKVKLEHTGPTGEPHAEKADNDSDEDEVEFEDAL